MINERWDLRFLALAKHIAQWSKDPSTLVGAVIVRPDRTICSLGYNGLPRGVQNEQKILMDRGLKLRVMVHAEVNAILSAAEVVAGCTIYVWPFQPCAQCAAQIVQSGIKRVVTLSSDNERSWAESFSVARNLFEAVGVDLTFYPPGQVP
jgi:dCMP deaminase